MMGFDWYENEQRRNEQALIQTVHDAPSKEERAEALIAIKDKISLLKWNDLAADFIRAIV